MELNNNNSSPIEIYFNHNKNIKYEEIEYFINISDKYCYYTFFTGNGYNKMLIYDITHPNKNISKEQCYKLIDKCIDILYKIDNYKNIIGVILDNIRNDKYNIIIKNNYSDYFIKIITDIINSYNIKAVE